MLAVNGGIPHNFMPPMNAENYSLESWLDDLRALTQQFAAAGRGDEQALLRYVHAKYPDPLDADDRAHRIGLAFAFLSRNAASLEESGLVVTGSDTHIAPPRLWIALWEWLVFHQWDGLPDPPELVGIVHLATRPWPDEGS
jgi:hypothetical protein